MADSEGQDGKPDVDKRASAVFRSHLQSRHGERLPENEWTSLDAAFYGLFDRAIEGDVSAARELLNRAYGRPQEEKDERETADIRFEVFLGIPGVADPPSNEKGT